MSGKRSYTCYTSTPETRLDIETAGKTAFVVDGGRRIELRFVPTVWPRMEDRYEGRGYVLTLDPEAVLLKPNGQGVGPCQG